MFQWNKALSLHTKDIIELGGVNTCDGSRKSTLESFLIESINNESGFPIFTAAASDGIVSEAATHPLPPPLARVFVKCSTLEN